MCVYLSGAIGEELLKKTGSGNLRMVVDEPDGDGLRDDRLE